MDKKMLAHVADAVENTHLEVMIRTFALFFALRFPMATILKPGKGLFRLEGIYGVPMGRCFAWDRGLESGNRLN